MHQLLNTYSVSLLECRNDKSVAIHNLLTNYSRYTAEYSARKYQAEKNFIESPEIKNWYEKSFEKRAISGERFNVFSALWLDRREIYHSRFLAYLLDPTGHHDQGYRFLNEFLSIIGLDGIDTRTKGQNVSIITEYDIGNLGRIDIVVKVPHAVIAIENKVDAGEQDEQVKRYREWLDEIKPIQGARVETKLVFLTPDGRAPRSGPLRPDDKKLSYGVIASFIDKVKNGIPDRISAVLEQYISICKSIHEGECLMSKLDKDSYNLLTQENHLKVALDIATTIELVKVKIKSDFLSNIRDIIKEKIEDDKVVGWDVSVKQESDGWVKIHTKSHMDSNPNFACYIQYLFHDYKNVFGWQRPAGIDLKAAEQSEFELSDRMKRTNDFKVDGWWLGWKALEPRLPFSDNDTIVDVFTDNQTSDHPLAKQVASTLFTCFEQWYKDVEKLPTFINIQQKSQN